MNQHVWVGSFSKNIHILDVETVCRKLMYFLIVVLLSMHCGKEEVCMDIFDYISDVSQLSFLEDVPRDMALSQDGQ